MLVTDADDHLSILFTDVEGSTARWESETDKMSESLARHDQIVREIIEAAGGLIFSLAGDSFGAVFTAAADALDAARSIQRAIQQEDWSGGVDMRVRMALHSGPVYQRDNGAYGPEIVRAAILCEIGHAGQILCTREMVDKLPGIETLSLGRFRLRKISEPQHVHQIGTESFARLRNVTTKVCTVPAGRDALIGRREHTAALRELMDSTRLLTLVGPGGVGKTTLASDLALRLYDTEFDGVHLIELDTLSDATELTSAVARGLNLTLLNDVDAVTQLLDYLAGRNSLLLFDNCEHVLRPAADLIDTLLARCATLKVIATSRESLDVRGETVWRVPALPASTAATELFLRVANQRSGVSFDTPLNRAAIEDICDLLDGLPLAIELAAARTRMLSVEQIGAMLRDQLQTLNLQGRQRRRRTETLGDVVRWSYELLDDSERTALRRLAVFNGGFSLQDAPAIIDCDDLAAMDLVDALIARSLIDTRADAEGAPRFAMLNTIRAFGLEQLRETGEMAATAERHCRHFVAMAERARHPFLPDPLTARLHRVELLNLIAAANWAADNGHPELSARIATGCVIELDWQGEFTNGIRWSRGVYGNTDEHAFNALVTEAFLRGQEGVLSQESALAMEAVALAGEARYLLLPVAICLGSLADIVSSPDTALRRVSDAYAAAQDAPQPRINKAFIDVHAALFDLFNDQPQQLLDRLQGFRGGMANYGRVRAYLDLGDVEAAGAVLEQAAKDPADAWLHCNDLAQSLWCIAIGALDDAARALTLSVKRDSGRRRWQDGDFLIHFAALHEAAGNLERATELIENCRSRHGLIGTTALKLKTRLAGWPPQYDNPQSLAWLSNHYARDATDRILAIQPRLLSEELAHWGGVLQPSSAQRSNA